MARSEMTRNEALGRLRDMGYTRKDADRILRDASQRGLGRQPGVSVTRDQRTSRYKIKSWR